MSTHRISASQQTELVDNSRIIVETFLQGHMQGIKERGQIPEHLETMISHLFLFPDTVYKICKRDNDFFNEHFRNLSNKESRFAFYKSDFFENNFFSPEVYIELLGLHVDVDNMRTTLDFDAADDLVIKMNRINLKYNLSTLLHQKEITEEDCRAMGYQQTKAVALFPDQPTTTENYYTIFERRLDDLRAWMHSAPDYFSNIETDEIIRTLKAYLEHKKEDFLGFNTADYVVSLDNHSDNVFYKDGKIFFLDIYPPKEDWMIVAPWINIYRPATDILILGGENYARAFLQGYKDYYGVLDERHELFYFLYSAAIQAVSLHNLSTHSSTKKEDSLIYKQFVINNTRRLQKETMPS